MPAKQSKAKKLDREQYESKLVKLQIELNHLQQWAIAEGKRVLVIFEGRDAAGKGGAIEAISSCLNPRNCKVVALSKPTERERSQWYFQRYAQYLPAVGEIVLFDRSWYNRAGVEKVMGYCTPEQHQQFLKDVPVFEDMLARDGIVLRKYYLSCDQEKQEKRFLERIQDPLKRWKISPIDLSARDKYDDYTAARESMFTATHSKTAPWTVVDMNDQKRGRLNLLRHLLDSIADHAVKPEPIEFPPLKKKKLSVESFKAKVQFATAKF
jgi:polyphosphate kinase